MSDEAEPQGVLVVGGGVSGLYCAWKLAERKHRVTIMELADRWGGRMETSIMAGFVAEYGPMRFELHLQPKFAALIKDLELKTIRFTGPRPAKIDFPKYALAGVEQKIPDANALLMLRRGLLLIMGKALRADDPAGVRDHQDWINGLTEVDFDKIRREQKLPRSPDVFLWQTGLWNALAVAGLSHQAVMLVRDVGTFYHMLPDNLNAAEWTIWWLRAMKSLGDELSTINGGTGLIGDGLKKILADNPLVSMKPRHEVLTLRNVAGGVDVVFREQGTVRNLPFKHVILALPQAPLKAIAQASSGAFPTQILKDLDAVNGFPMVKVFFVTSDPWWKPDQPPQERANRMPTREVHYQRRGELGMVLIYTDRPATEYWNVYVEGEVHDRAEIDKNEVLKQQFGLWMAKDIMAAMAAPDPSTGGLMLADDALARFAGLSEDEVAASIADSVVTYGIRDWARPPYGAANHSWKPKTRSWQVMQRFAAFALAGGASRNVHICGEAYSDYSGFIEGALRTADAALASLPDADAELAANSASAANG